MTTRIYFQSLDGTVTVACSSTYTADHHAMLQWAISPKADSLAEGAWVNGDRIAERLEGVQVLNPAPGVAGPHGEPLRMLNLAKPARAYGFESVHYRDEFVKESGALPAGIIGPEPV